MAKTTAPLLSFGASGQVAKSVVFSKWRGRPYARRHVVPANPNSSEQQLTRGVFSFLQQTYKFAPADVTDAFTAYAKGQVMTDRNAFSKANLSALRTDGDLSHFQLSPGVLGGQPPKTVVGTAGSHQLSIAITQPDLIAAGWSIDHAVAAVIKEQDPQTGVEYQIVSDVDDVAASGVYTVVLAGLSLVPYHIVGWLVWIRPDGQTAWGPGLFDTKTPTA